MQANKFVAVLYCCIADSKSSESKRWYTREQLLHLKDSSLSEARLDTMPERSQFWTCIKADQLATKDVPASLKKNWIPKVQTVETLSKDQGPKQPVLEPQKDVCILDKNEKKYRNLINLKNRLKGVKNDILK